MAKPLLIISLAFAMACGVRSPMTTNKTAALATQQALPHTSIHVVILGDSLAYGAGDETGKGIGGRLDPAVFSTLNLGVNGAQTSDLIGKLGQQRFRDRIADADAIILSIGANDLWRDERRRQETLRDPV